MGEEQVPVFVYGTLRPGEYNHDRAERYLTAAVPAVLADHALYVAGLPLVVPQPGGRVVGDLLKLDPGRYGAAIRDLDRLEGYREGARPEQCLYVRTRVTVSVDGPVPQTRPAWVYLAGPRMTGRQRGGLLVASGDFKEVSCAA